MKKLTLLLAVIVSAIGLAGFNDAAPLSSRCIGIPPLCSPGQHQFCLCESDISLNCRYICASGG